MQNSEICVLVTGVGGGSAGREIMKAFKLSKHKYKIVAADMSAKNPGLFETKDRYLVPPATSPDYIDYVLKLCKKEDIQVIAPGSDPEIEKISKNARLFEEQGIRVLVNPWNIIKLCVDKYELMNFLQSKNVKCPNFFLFQNESDLKKIDSYPVVIKPRFGAGSRNVFVAQDEEESLFFCRYLKKYGAEPLIQKYVGSHDEEFTIGVLYLDNGKLVTSIAMKRILGSGLSTRQIIEEPQTKTKYVISSGFSQGLIDDFKEIRLMGEKIAQALQANGPINIQCRLVDSKIMPFEINPRFSGTTGARSLVGYNEPDMFCRYLFYNEIPTQISYKHGYVMRDLIETFISKEDTESISRI